MEASRQGWYNYDSDAIGPARYVAALGGLVLGAALLRFGVKAVSEADWVWGMVVALFSISLTNFLMRWLAPRYAVLVLSTPGVLYCGWHFLVEGLEMGWARASVWLLMPVVIITFSSCFAYGVSRSISSARSASRDA